jgi:hypothetical protein
MKDPLPRQRIRPDLPAEENQRRWMRDNVVPAKRIPFAGECFTEALRAIG